MMKEGFIISPDKFDAVIFDLDGVVTRTASVHSSAWKKLFDDYLKERAGRTGEGWAPFDEQQDYLQYVDGKPRYDGVKSFLQSRGIELPWGDPDDPPERETICGLGNRKNQYFQQHLQEHGVEVYESTIHLIRQLHRAGIRTAIISSSRNCRSVLESAGALQLFEHIIDGVESARIKLKGKPAPDIFLEAARRLGVEPDRAVVVEDAISGVQAGRAGGFALVIGVDRAGQADALKANGAGLVVSDLEEVEMEEEEKTTSHQLPSALEQIERIITDEKPVAVFLDYDGTLTPIVEHPEDAVLSPQMREAVQRLAQKCPVAIVSGRDLADVRQLVGLENLVFAGSHGFDIAGPDGLQLENQEANKLLSLLDETERQLEPELAQIEGSRIERKKYSIAVHFRQVREEDEPRVGEVVKKIAGENPSLRFSQGKKVFEIQPDIDWHKGRAVLWLIEALKLQDHLPLYLGDDTTDEDAFRVLKGRGVGIIVKEQERPTAADFALADVNEVEQFLRKIGNK